MENLELQTDFCQFQTSHQQQLEQIPRVHWECLQDKLIRGVSLGRRDVGLPLLATLPACMLLAVLLNIVSLCFSAYTELCGGSGF